MMHYFLLFVSVSLDTLKNTYYNYFSKNIMRGHRDTLLFNAVSCVGAVVYFLCRGADLHVSSFSLIMAIVFGAVTVGAQYFSLLAMGLGPMSYSVLFTYLSMLIPTLFGVFYYGQTVSVLQVIGLTLMVITFFLSIDLKDKSEMNLKWLAAAFASFLGWGLVGVCQQLHQNSAHASELNGFLLWTFIFSAVMFTVLFLFSKKDCITAGAFGFFPAVLIVLAGVAIGAINEINLYLSGVMPGIIFFPIVNGGVIILSAIAAVLIFREKLSAKQLLGLLSGILSVLFLGM